jgi:hypothetical protein
MRMSKWIAMTTSSGISDLCGPHPEELEKQASRRMEAGNGLAAILRDARSALLRMRIEQVVSD